MIYFDAIKTLLLKVQLLKLCIKPLALFHFALTYKRSYKVHDNFVMTVQYCFANKSTFDLIIVDP